MLLFAIGIAKAVRYIWSSGVSAMNGSIGRTVVISSQCIYTQQISLYAHCTHTAESNLHIREHGGKLSPPPPPPQQSICTVVLNVILRSLHQKQFRGTLNPKFSKHVPEPPTS